MTFERISKLQEALTANQAVLLFNEYNRIYFSGFPSSAGTIVITKSKAFFLIDFRYYEKAKNTVENMDVLLCERLYKQIGDILEISPQTVRKRLQRARNAFKELLIKGE